MSIEMIVWEKEENWFQILFPSHAELDEHLNHENYQMFFRFGNDTGNAWAFILHLTAPNLPRE